MKYSLDNTNLTHILRTCIGLKSGFHFGYPQKINNSLQNVNRFYVLWLMSGGGAFPIIRQNWLPFPSGRTDFAFHNNIWVFSWVRLWMYMFRNVLQWFTVVTFLYVLCLIWLLIFALWCCCITLAFHCILLVQLHIVEHGEWWLQKPAAVLVQVKWVYFAGAKSVLA